MYALNEVNALLSRLPAKIDVRDPIVRYLSAIFAELAYYHIPQWEIDNKKRAFLIPCDAYQEIVRATTVPDIRALIPEADIADAEVFILEERGVIVVGVRVRRILFIGYRGTQFLFDWPINLRSSRLALARSPLSDAKFHKGFAIEAIRISGQIREQLRRLGRRSFDHVVLSGHSLGGAVAAISALVLPLRSRLVCIMGAPRYANWSAYAECYRRLPTQVRRAGDGVPTIPPRWFGYADHPQEFGTDGSHYFDPIVFSGLTGGLFRWLAFLARRVRPHSMERYREEMGVAAGASMSDLPLAPHERLRSVHLKQSPPKPEILQSVVYLKAHETARWDFEARIRELDHVETQSRYIVPDKEDPGWARFMIFASQMPSDDTIRRIADDLGASILRIERYRPE